MLQLDSIANLSMDIEDVCSLDVSRVSSPEAFEVFAKGINLTEDFLLDERWSHAQMDNSPRAQFDLIMLQMLPEVYDPAYLESHGGIFGIRLTGVAEYTVAAINRRVVVMHDLPQDMQSGEEKLHLEVAPDVFLGFARGLVLALSEDILHDDDEYEDRPISNVELQLHGMPAGGTTGTGMTGVNGWNDRMFGDINGYGAGDTLWGLGGADLLDGRTGNDTHYGGDGDDILIANEGRNIYDGGEGFDTFDINGTAQGSHLGQLGVGFDIDLSNGIDGGTDQYGSTYHNVERFVGGDGFDSLNLGEAHLVYKEGDNGIAMLSDGQTVVWENFDAILYKPEGAVEPTPLGDGFYKSATVEASHVEAMVSSSSTAMKVVSGQSQFYFDSHENEYSLQLGEVSAIYTTTTYGMAIKSDGEVTAWYNPTAIDYEYPSDTVSHDGEDVYGVCGDNVSTCGANTSNYSACGEDAAHCGANFAFLATCGANASACGAAYVHEVASGVSTSACAANFVFVSACATNASACAANVGMITGCAANASACAANVGIISGCAANASGCGANVSAGGCAANASGCGANVSAGGCGANASACGADILTCAAKAGVCGVDVPGDIISACAVNVVPVLPSC